MQHIKLPSVVQKYTVKLSNEFKTKKASVYSNLDVLNDYAFSMDVIVSFCPCH